MKILSKILIVNLICFIMLTTVLLYKHTQVETVIENKQWVMVLGSSWMSLDKLDNSTWFSMIKIANTITAVEVNLYSGVYSIHYNLGDETGWKSLINPMLLQELSTGKT